MSDLIATVVLPTTGDRGPLLPYSVASILAQNVRELEVFIIGDGVNEATRRIIRELQATDERIKFFDHPKHERRGEVYRHQALKEARGEIVCYLCDRDLLLPHHVASLHHNLQTNDLVVNISYDVSREQELSFGLSNVPLGELDLNLAWHRHGVHKLSAVGHTLAAYRALPVGWRTTPQEEYTDRHMWRQFLAQPGLRAYNCEVPSFLYFERDGHPGWPTEKRLVELKKWWAIIEQEDAFSRHQQLALRRLLNERLSIWQDMQATKRASLRYRLQRKIQKLASRGSKPVKQPRW